MRLIIVLKTGDDVVNTFKRDSLSSDLGVQKSALKNLFSTLVMSDSDKVVKQVALVVSRLKERTPKPPTGSCEELFLRLDSQFPGGDIGMFLLIC